MRDAGCLASTLTVDVGIQAIITDEVIATENIFASLFARLDDEIKLDKDKEKKASIKADVRGYEGQSAPAVPAVIQAYETTPARNGRRASDDLKSAPAAPAYEPNSSSTVDPWAFSAQEYVTPSGRLGDLVPSSAPMNKLDRQFAAPELKK
jgi:hypothetical protein